MLALTHPPSELLTQCELTHLDRKPIDIELARQQHHAYRAALKNAGFEVRVCDMNLGYADSVFVEDVAVVLNELIVLGAMGVPSREPESLAWKEVLSEFRTVYELPDGATLEGGDVLRIGSQLLIGQSRRTNRKAIEAMADIVRPHGYSVHAIPVAKCLHLKTACTALDDDTLLVNPEWLDWDRVASGSLQIIKTLVSADSWGANVVRLRDRLIANSQNRGTIEQLCDAGYRVVAVDLSEFAKAEAGATCLSLLIE